MESLRLQTSVIFNRKLPLFRQRNGGVIILIVEGEDELAVVQTVPLSLCTGQVNLNPSRGVPLGSWGAAWSPRPTTFIAFVSSLSIFSVLFHFRTLHGIVKAPKSH